MTFELIQFLVSKGALSGHGIPLVHAVVALPKDNGLLERIVEEAAYPLSSLDGRGRTLLHIAVAEEYPMGPRLRTKRIRFLLEQQFNVGAQDSEGNTPIHIAVQDREYDDLRLLLEGANAVAFRENYKRETPLNIAVRLGQKDKIKAVQEAMKKVGL